MKVSIYSGMKFVGAIFETEQTRGMYKFINYCIFWSVLHPCREKFFRKGFTSPEMYFTLTVTIKKKFY
jgi:hypothetical protein